MFHATMAAAIGGARTLAGMDELARTLWQAHASGAVEDHEAQALAELLQARRAEIREHIVPVGVPAGRASLFPPRRRPTSPDKATSRERRRLLAASGPMPPHLAARFTTGQLAVLRIVVDEVRAKGVCGLPIDAIAARAGVCRRLAQATVRLAESDGLLIVQERRHQGRKNDPNLIRILSREWQAWMRRGGRKGGERGPASSEGHRVQMDAPHGYEGVQSGEHEAGGTLAKLPRRQGRFSDDPLFASPRVASRTRAGIVR